MEKASDDELDDTPPDDASEEGSEFVEVDPSGRYGRYNEVLGKGAYKTVYKGFDDLGGIEVAWNQVKIHDVLHSAGDIERLYSELHLLKTLKHKNIIKFYSSWVDTRNRNVNFITEIFTSGTLRQYRKRHKRVKLRAIKHWARQILRGLVFLHSRDPPIIHRDLKCDNIFINGNSGEVKIGDLGLATILHQAPTAQSVIGTPEFMAPELYEEHYNELVDIYSFGMCLLEMLTSEYPYSECTNAAQIYKKVTTGKRPAALGKIKNPQTREFLEKCLASASQRLHARELLMDPFLLSDEDAEMQETSVSGRSNLYGGVQGLDPIPENTDLRCADYLLSAQRHVEVMKNQSKSEGPPRLDIPSERLSVVDIVSPKDGMKTCKDFRIKGRKQDDKKVLVRIRIASSAGEVRIIQFDFDVDADTAMSVASEMVAELDLSDQDVTTIADMIDAEIMALIPDWTPGLAFDDAVDIDVDREQKGPVVDTPLVSDVRDDGLPVSPPGTMVGPLDDSQVASGLTYGRFEEVGCNVISSDRQQQESDALEFFSDFSADSGSDFSLDVHSSSEISADNDLIIQSLDDGVETEAKSGSLPSLGGKAPGVNKVNMKQEHLMFSNSDEKLDDSEVLGLIMKQQEELQLLQPKDEEALFDLKMRVTPDAPVRIDNILPEGSLMSESTREVSQKFGSEDEYDKDANSEAYAHRAEAASCCSGISNRPCKAVDTSERSACALLSQLESASTGSIFISEYVRGHTAGVASEIKESIFEEPLREVDRSKNMHEVDEDLLNKVSGKESKGTQNNVLGEMTDTKSNAIFDKDVQVSKVTTELVSSQSRSMPPNHEDVKPGLTTTTKRELHLELYKASSNKEKVSSSKSSESLHILDGASKTSSIKDANQEQLKKMADFADKLINNLSQSNNKYIGTSSVKGVALHNGQQGVTIKNHGGPSILTSQHGVAAKGAPGAMIQNGQQSIAVKHLASAKGAPGATVQGGQQCVNAKNPPGSMVQNSTAKSLSSTAVCNSQQVASMKSTAQASQQGITGKSLSGVVIQNGQQSVVAKNLTGASVQNSHHGSAAKDNVGATQLGATAKNIVSGNGQTGQQGSSAGHPRQQPRPTETTKA